MSALFAFSLVCTAGACLVEDRFLMADDAGEEGASTPGEVSTEATPARLIEFDGGALFLRTSRRLRVWRPSVEFDLTVDPQGRPSGCELVDRFRKNYVNMKLCEVLMEHHRFEPARDERSQPVEGTYHARLNYAELRANPD